MSVLTSLDAVSTVQSGSVLDLGEGCGAHHAVQVFTSGNPTFHVDVYLSLDGVNWFLTTTATSPTWVEVDRVARYLRCDLSVISGGTSPTVTAIIGSATGSFPTSFNGTLT